MLWSMAAAGCSKGRDAEAYREHLTKLRSTEFCRNPSYMIGSLKWGYVLTNQDVKFSETQLFEINA